MSPTNRLALVVVACTFGLAFVRGCEETLPPPVPEHDAGREAGPVEPDAGCPIPTYQCCTDAGEIADPVCDADGDQHCADGQTVADPRGCW